MAGLVSQPAGLDLGVSSGSLIKNSILGISTIPTNSNTYETSISPVNLSKAIVVLDGFRSDGSGSDWSYILPKVKFSAVDKLYFSRHGNGIPLQIRWTIIEFANIKSLQGGELIINTTSFVNIPISPVSPKAQVFISYSGLGNTTYQPLWYINGANALTIENPSQGVIDIQWYIVDPI